MIGNFTEILIDTDVLLQHLQCRENEESDLLFLMQNMVCFTTAINAAEIYFYCKNDNEKEAADKLLNSLKILGIHSRYALKIYGKENKNNSVRSALTGVVADYNKLPVITYDVERYGKLNRGVFTPEQLRG